MLVQMLTKTGAQVLAGWALGKAKQRPNSAPVPSTPASTRASTPASAFPEFPVWGPEPGRQACAVAEAELTLNRYPRRDGHNGSHFGAPPAGQSIHHFLDQTHLQKKLRIIFPWSTVISHSLIILAEVGLQEPPKTLFTRKI